MQIEIINEQQLTPGGGTINISVDSEFTLIPLIGSATLTSSWTVQSSGTPKKGMKIVVAYDATLNFNGNTLTIFGLNIPSFMQAIPFNVEAYYNGSAWVTRLKTDLAASEGVSGDSIVQNTLNGNRLVAASVALTKLANLTEGSIIIGNNSNIPTALDIKTDKGIIIGNGTSAAVQVISGDITIDNAGVSAIGNGKVTEEMLAFTIGTSFQISQDINQAGVNGLFDNPVVLYPDSNVEASEAIAIVQIYMLLKFDTAAFAAAGNVVIETTGGQLLATFLEADVEGTANRIFAATLPATRDLVQGEGVQIRALTSNPTGGGASSGFRVRGVVDKILF